MISRQKTGREKPQDQGADKIDRDEYEPGEERGRQNPRPFRRDVSDDLPVDPRSFADDGLLTAPVGHITTNLGFGSDAQRPYSRFDVSGDPIRDDQRSRGYSYRAAYRRRQVDTAACGDDTATDYCR